MDTQAEFEEAPTKDCLYRSNAKINGKFGRTKAYLYTEIIKYSDLLKKARRRNQVFTDLLFNNKIVENEPHNVDKMKDFESLFVGLRTRKQVKSIVMDCVEKKILKKEGRTADTRYSITDEYMKMNEIMTKAFQIGLREMWNRGEFTAPISDQSEINE